MRRAVTGLVIALLALALADLGCGILYRVVTGESLYYGVVDRERGVNRSYRIRSAEYSHDLRPNVDVAASWESPYRIATNSLGFKDRAVREVARGAAGPRVVFIGDSFTEGVGVPFEKTFVGIVDDALRARGIEVLNAGVSSYAPAIYYRKTRNLLEERRLEFSHLIVLLDISDAQDEAEDYEIDADGDVVFRPENAPALVEFLRENTVLYAAVRFLKLRRAAAKEAVAPRHPLNASLENPRSLWTVDEETYRRYGEPGLRAMRAHMDQLVQLARAHGVDVTVVVYPWPTQIIARDLDSRQVRFWREWAQEQGIRFVDLFPGFISADDAANRRTVQDLFIRDDFHWNEKGHRRVAELLLPKLPPALAGSSPSGAADRSAPRADREAEDGGLERSPGP